jgi:hypothetical protein
MNLDRFFLTGFVGLLLTSITSAQTQWIGGDAASWNEAANWSAGAPGPDNSVIFSEMGMSTIEIREPGTVQGILKGGLGTVTLSGAPLTLGDGYNKSFNSILVNAGSMEIQNDLVNSANKRITLHAAGEALTLTGNLDTGGQTTQIGNLGSGRLTFAGDRSGGNSLLIVDGEVRVTGVLSNNGGGNTQALNKGTIVSARDAGPTIERGSRGLALRPEGTFRFAADNQIAGYTNLNGGTLDLNGFTNAGLTIGNLSLTADSTIDFSDPAAETLAIGDVSRNSEWKAGAKLQILGFSDGDSLRFGDHAEALTATQLGAIQFDGKPAQIDRQGFVTPAK